MTPKQVHAFIFSALGSLLLWQRDEAIEAYHTAPATGFGKQALLATGRGYLAAGDLVGAREVLERGRWGIWKIRLLSLQKYKASHQQ